MQNARPIAILILMSLLPHTATAKSVVDVKPHAKIIIERYRQHLLESPPPNSKTVKKLVDSLKTNGQWPDINYADKGNPDWVVHGHLLRIKTLGRALAHLKSALHLDGVDDYVSVPDHADLRLGKQQTLAAWGNPDSIRTDWVRVVGKDNSTYRKYRNCDGHR